MKNYILIVFFIGIFIPISLSQNKPTPESLFGKEVITAIEKNLKVEAKEHLKKGACTPLKYIDQFNLKELVPPQKPFEELMKKFDFSYGNKLKNLKIKLNLPQGMSVEDFAIEKLSSSNSLNNFIKKLTGKQLFDLDAEDQKILMDFYLNHPIKKGVATTSKSQKLVKAKFLPCYASSNSELSLANWRNYPNTRWNIITTISIVCDCDEMPLGDLAEGTIVYSAEAQVIFSSKLINFQKAKLFGPTSSKGNCCGEEKEIPEESDEENGPTEEYVPQQQILGVSLGVGFEQDFDEISFCLGAEYSYLFKESNNGSGYYIGAEANLVNTNFMDFSNTQISVGPQIQAWTPISINKDTQWVNEIQGDFIFGSQDNFGNKDNFTGYGISLNTGLNVMLSSNVSVGVTIPVVTYQSLAFKSDLTNEKFKTNNTTLLINKANPAKISVRFGF